MKKYTLLIGMLFTILTVQAQTAVSTIQQYGGYLKTWMDEDDIEMRDKITQMCEGKKSCRVDDQLMKEFVRLSQKALANGDKVMDTYLNGFENLDGKTTIKLTNISLLSEDAAPNIKDKNKNEIPKQYVTADILLDNKDLKFTGSDLFWVRGNMITNILDNNDAISVGKAIRLYSQHKYEEAFRMFRKLAYQDIFNYEAQYYLAVMEIKKQGCSFLSPKVRDAECLWFCTKPFVLTDGSESGRDLQSLFQRFSMDATKNIYAGIKFYTTGFYQVKPCSEGLMPYRIAKGKGRSYGFINESGQVVIPAKYDFVYPFGRNGLSLVLDHDKAGVIDPTGREVIPFGTYDAICRGFKNGNNIARIGNTAYLINKEGTIIKSLVTSDKNVWLASYYYGDYLVVGEGEDMKYIFDGNGNLFWKGRAGAYSINAEKGTIVMGDTSAENTTPIKETEVPYNW